MAKTRTASKATSAAPVADHRIVVLSGKDAYLQTERLRQFEAALRERYGDLDRFSLDGTTATLAEVLDELRSYGLMQHHKMVVLEEADKFLAKGDHRAAMERYAAAPMEESSLVMRASTWNRGKLDALVEKVGVMVACEPPSPERAVSWCVERAKRQHGTTIEREAAAILVEHIGPNLARLDVELGKLAAATGYQRPIATADVDDMVGLVREEKGWEIQHALLCGGGPAGLRKLRELREVSRASEVVVMFALVDLARKVHDATVLLRDGVSSWQLAQAVGLWGPQRDAMRDALARAAGRLTPHQAAELLHAAVVTEQSTRNGYAPDADRALEGLAVRLADSLR